MFEPRHGGLDPGAPAINHSECIAAFVKASFLVGRPVRSILKSGKLPVMFGGLYGLTP
jgi:hypothetical protein